MKTVLTFFWICTGSLLCAQSAGTYSSHIIQSEAFGKEREIKVYLTESVSAQPSTSPFVLYVFDGQFDPFFGMVTQTVNYLSSVGYFPDCIVVGISTEHRPREFTPAASKPRTIELWDDVPIGDAAVLEAHLRDEVFPFVESRFQTMPLRVAMGHSLGGTFVSQSVIRDHGLFKAAISISPNTVYDYNWMARDLSEALKDKNLPKAWHYMTAGTEGDMENSFRIGALLADSVYRAHEPSDFIWHFKVYEGLTHMTTPIQSILEGLSEFNHFWSISDSQTEAFLADSSQSFVAHLQSHFNKMGAWAGFEIPLSADEINELGYVAAYEEMWEAAMEVIDWGLSLHPNDPNLYDSKGECLENLGRTEEALASYQMALEVLQSAKHAMDDEQYAYYEEAFNKNFQRVKELLQE